MLVDMSGTRPVRPAGEEDDDLYYVMSTSPGAHLPDAWVGNNVERQALMDLAPYRRRTLLPGVSGELWARAAERVGAELEVPLETVVIGPGREITDLYCDWAKLREIGEPGVILVRPATGGLAARYDAVGAPRSLKDLGMPEDGIEKAVTPIIAAVPTDNPTPLTDVKLVALRAAWEGDVS